jgi:hypothetical protein
MNDLPLIARRASMTIGAEGLVEGLIDRRFVIRESGDSPKE